MKIKIQSEALAKTLGLRLNEVVDVESKNEVPIKKEWRNRIRDAKIDNCISVVTKKKGDK